MARFKLARLDDWEALYDNGTKVEEGHRLDARDLFRILEADAEVVEVPEMAVRACEWDGWVPDDLDELLARRKDKPTGRAWTD